MYLKMTPRGFRPGQTLTRPGLNGFLSVRRTGMGDERIKWSGGSAGDYNEDGIPYGTLASTVPQFLAQQAAQGLVWNGEEWKPQTQLVMQQLNSVPPAGQPPPANQVISIPAYATTQTPPSAPPTPAPSIWSSAPQPSYPPPPAAPAAAAPAPAAYVSAPADPAVLEKPWYQEPKYIAGAGVLALVGLYIVTRPRK